MKLYLHDIFLSVKAYRIYKELFYLQYPLSVEAYRTDKEYIEFIK